MRTLYLLLWRLGALLLLTAAVALPAQRVRAQTSQLCFTETGFHCISGRFLEFLEAERRPAGVRLSRSRRSARANNRRQVPTQYFERKRFELHPENAAPYDVLLGRLGDELLPQPGPSTGTRCPKAGPQSGCHCSPRPATLSAAAVL